MAIHLLEAERIYDGQYKPLTSITLIKKRLLVVPRWCLVASPGGKSLTLTLADLQCTMQHQVKLLCNKCTQNVTIKILTQLADCVCLNQILLIHLLYANLPPSPPIHPDLPNGDRSNTRVSEEFNKRHYLIFWWQITQRRGEAPPLAVQCSGAVEGSSEVVLASFSQKTKREEESLGCV